MMDGNAKIPNGPPLPLDYSTADKPRGSKTLRRIAIGLLLFFGGLVVAAVFLPSINRSRSQGGRVKCPSNMRQIGQGCAMYANDHHGRYPDDLGTLFLNEDLDASVAVCPNTNDVPAIGPTTQAVVTSMLTPGHLSYVYLGKGLTDATATADVVVLYEPLSNHSNEGMNVHFGDGHTEWLTAGQAQPLLQQVAAGTWPVRLPPAPVAASQPSQ